MSTFQLAREPTGVPESGGDWVEDTRDVTWIVPIPATSRHTGVCSTYHGALVRIGRGPLYSGVTTDLHWLRIFQVQCGFPGTHIRVPRQLLQLALPYRNRKPGQA